MTNERNEEISDQICEAFAQFESDVNTAFAELKQTLMGVLEDQGDPRPRRKLNRIIDAWCADVEAAVEILNDASSSTGPDVVVQVEEAQELSA